MEVIHKRRQIIQGFQDFTIQSFFLRFNFCFFCPHFHFSIVSLKRDKRWKEERDYKNTFAEDGERSAE